MKNKCNVPLVRLFGIIALVAVIGFSMAACGGEEETENQALNAITPDHITLGERGIGWWYQIDDGYLSTYFFVSILGEGEHVGECVGTFTGCFNGTWKIQKNDAGVFKLEVTITSVNIGDSFNGVYDGVLSNSGHTMTLTRTDGTKITLLDRQRL
jgi:hypothetical protein